MSAPQSEFPITLYEDLLSRHQKPDVTSCHQLLSVGQSTQIPEYYLWQPWAAVKADFAEKVQPAPFSISAILVEDTLRLVIGPDNYVGDETLITLIFNGSQVVELTLNKGQCFDAEKCCYQVAIPDGINVSSDFWLEVLYDNQLIHYQKLRRLVSIKKELGYANIAKIEPDAFFIFVVPPVEMADDKPKFLGQVYAEIDGHVTLPLRCKSGMRNNKPAWFFKFELSEQLADGNVHHVAVKCGHQSILARSFFVIGSGSSWLSGTAWLEQNDLQLSLSDSNLGQQLELKLLGCSRKPQQFVLQQTDRPVVFDAKAQRRNICAVQLPRRWHKKQHKVQFEVRDQQGAIFQFVLDGLL